MNPLIKLKATSPLLIAFALLVLGFCQERKPLSRHPPEAIPTSPLPLGTTPFRLSP